jgi:hypothetical protein
MSLSKYPYVICKDLFNTGKIFRGTILAGVVGFCLIRPTIMGKLSIVSHDCPATNLLKEIVKDYTKKAIKIAISFAFLNDMYNFKKHVSKILGTENDNTYITQGSYSYIPLTTLTYGVSLQLQESAKFKILYANEKSALVSSVARDNTANIITIWHINGELKCVKSTTFGMPLSTNNLEINGFGDTFAVKDGQTLVKGNVCSSKINRHVCDANDNIVCSALNRDVWVYNSSTSKIVCKTIDNGGQLSHSFDVSDIFGQKEKDIDLTNIFVSEEFYPNLIISYFNKASHTMETIIFNCDTEWKNKRFQISYLVKIPDDNQNVVINRVSFSGVSQNNNVGGCALPRFITYTYTYTTVNIIKECEMSVIFDSDTGTKISSSDSKNAIYNNNYLLTTSGINPILIDVAKFKENGHLEFTDRIQHNDENNVSFLDFAVNGDKLSVLMSNGIFQVRELMI